MTLMEQAAELYRKAREHKSSSQYHRRQAQQMMEELREFCEHAGIQFETIKAGGETLHGRHESPSRSQFDNRT